ncbi:putative sugar kinase [Caldisphaera lagunensis DSM 15908]|uniref:NAD kinase n=1 Tax=Caldisphaera lagunensis (strain DSM 15908 / JCM 11604 / ANMR 0165 / IC-154) TaxID=1056495 RepID=L0ADK2_CALLD|nr:NAD(+)/NADH kinase [Caldisphaera lagunensis]AFZ71110.1 putative sugar kinase [Caldisphaera lagunensis DSM 15908]
MQQEKYGIVVKPNSNNAIDIALRVINILKKNKKEVLVEKESKENYNNIIKDVGEFNIDNNPPEKIIVIGGDGTLLRTVMREKTGNSIIMAIRAGKRGFLLDVEEYEIENRVYDFINNKYTLIEYPRLQSIFNGERKSCAMNDIVIFTADGSLVKLEIFYNKDRVYGVDGDGIVISTTVGSTAYSLSAGGPIVDPRLNLIILTPLNPVQLHIRPVVFPINGILDINVKEDSGEYYLNIDGQEKVYSKSRSSLRIELCDKPVKIARFRWWENYYERLFSRLLSYW